MRPAPFYGWVIVVGAFQALKNRAIWRRPALGIGLGLQAAAFLGFAQAASVPGLYAASIAFGFSYGRSPLSCRGPLGAGFIYDRTGSYGPAWMGSAALNVVALTLLRWARPPRRLQPSL